MPNTLEMNVPGRKIIVRAAIVRIEELSSLVFMVITVLVLLSCWVTRFWILDLRPRGACECMDQQDRCFE